MASFSRHKLLFLEQNSFKSNFREYFSKEKKVTDQYFYLRKCQTMQILPLDAKNNNNKKNPAKTEAVLLSKWTVSCELSALTARGLATSDFFFPGGVRWVWSWSSWSGTHRLCSRTGGWLWEAPTRPRMSHLLWLGDQSEMHKWLIWRKKQLWGAKWNTSRLHSSNRGSTWMEAEGGNSDDPR